MLLCRVCYYGKNVKCMTKCRPHFHFLLKGTHPSWKTPSLLTLVSSFLLVTSLKIAASTMYKNLASEQVRRSRQKSNKSKRERSPSVSSYESSDSSKSNHRTSLRRSRGRDSKRKRVRSSRSTDSSD